jgi:hypothetical protein
MGIKRSQKTIAVSRCAVVPGYHPAIPKHAPTFLSVILGVFEGVLTGFFSMIDPGFAAGFLNLPSNDIGAIPHS